MGKWIFKAYMKNIELVVARYNEDISWVDDFEVPYKIYNKGELNIKYPYTILKNIGRESNTYINHIVLNYYNLYEYTVFLQGFPFHHSKDTKDRILNNSKKFEFLDSAVMLNDLNDTPVEHRRSLYIVLGKIGMIGYLLNFIKPSYYYGHGAQYIVHKDLILNKSLNFWKKLLEVTETESYSPWVLERLFPYIFLNNE